jgi:hypothetical protein
MHHKIIRIIAVPKVTSYYMEYKQCGGQTHCIGIPAVPLYFD